ncbi:EAL domain-containing protein [Tannockella kyphosi]|uniref:EAL domain-containing protein n=1 Tax=Tannockella kyphosi TaxID=2899121 RepID=UPI002011B81D|nr:EAL domain-containing protein [Tannockella kyphosi]
MILIYCAKIIGQYLIYKDNLFHDRTKKNHTEYLLEGVCNVLKKYLFIIFSFLLCLLSLGKIQAVAFNEPTVVKVGYSEVTGFVNDPIISGREGYGYEYFNKIAEYLDGDYIFEYVMCKEDTILDMLESGVIDIATPYFKEQINEQDFLVSSNDFGENIAFLCTTNEEIVDITSLDGSTIGVYKGDPNISLIDELLTTYGYQANIVLFDQYDYYKDLDNNQCDYCLVYSMSPNMNLEIVMKLEAFPFYFITTNENQELMNDLNDAMKNIKSYEFLYQEQLYLKYYQYQISTNTYISDQELALLQAESSYCVGIHLLHSPFSYLDSEGQLQGIVVDFLELLEDKAGVHFDKYIIEGNDTTMYDFTMLYSNEDVLLNSGLSYSFLEQPLVLLENSGERVNNYVGSLSYYGVDPQYLQLEFGSENIIVYENLASMQEAYEENQIQEMILTSSALSYINSSVDSQNYYINPLDMSISFSIDFSSSMSNTSIHSFNKLIASIDDDMMEYIVLKHSYALTNSFSLVTYLQDNPLYVMALFALIVVVYFIFELNKRKELLNAIYFDKLTGLYSLEGFRHVLKTRMNQKKNNHYYLVSIDIDNFKYINELWGFETGTKVIKKNASFIKDKLQKSDVIARIRGDQFIILLQRENGLLLDSNIIIKDSTIFDDLEKMIGENFVFSYSVGVYEIQNCKLDTNFMIDCVDFARNKGKAFSEDTVFYFDNEVLDERTKNAQIITSMNYAIQEKEFILYYQPKVDLHTNKIVGAEALVRWYKNNAYILPSNFIPIFEKNGFIEKLDYYIFETVCQFIVANKDIDLPIISINMSGFTITKGNVLSKLKSILTKYDVSPNKIDIELTETAFIDNGDIVINTLNELRNYGFTVSMDDFGAGLSSLTRLKSITIDTLKIDRELIVENKTNHKGTSILKNILSLAKDIQVTTVGEGIETFEQLELLKSLGCDIGQGYYFYRPLCEDDFKKELQQ